MSIFDDVNQAMKLADAYGLSSKQLGQGQNQRGQAELAIAVVIARSELHNFLQKRLTAELRNVVLWANHLQTTAETGCYNSLSTRVAELQPVDPIPVVLDTLNRIVAIESEDSREMICSSYMGETEAVWAIFDCDYPCRRPISLLRQHLVSAFEVFGVRPNHSWLCICLKC